MYKIVTEGGGSKNRSLGLTRISSNEAPVYRYYHPCPRQLQRTLQNEITVGSVLGHIFGPHPSLSILYTTTCFSTKLFLIILYYIKVRSISEGSAEG